MPHGYSRYQAICLELQKLDLEVFDAVYRASKDGAGHDEVMALVEVEIGNYRDFYERIDKELDDLDISYGLAFTSIANPFNREESKK